MQVKFQRLHPSARIPLKAHPSDAGFDLTATSVTHSPDGTITYGTGIAIQLPPSHVALVFPRSSVYRTHLLLTNAVGVIDSGYRGEITCKFHSTQPDNGGIYAPGDRICQLIILPYPDIQFCEADHLDSSDRGTQGYGSTGK